MPDVMTGQSSWRRLATCMTGLATVGALVVCVSANAASTVEVAFLRGEQMTVVERSGSSIADGIRALLAGPTTAERRRGVTTQIPKSTPLRSVRVVDRVATVDLGESFVRGSDPDSASARLTQLVLTATARPGVRAVRLLIDGRAIARVGRYTTTKPLTSRNVRVPNLPPPEPQPAPKLGPPDDVTLELQTRLTELGYLDPSGVNGRPGKQTRFAVIAFQKWEGLQRDGIAGPATQAALATAVRPTPVTSGSGHRVEVLLDRQLALVIQDDAVLRAIDVSTGKAGYETLSGNWTIQRKYPRDWSVPYKLWLPYASYFVGGYAFHEYPDVPPYPASHGCVRTPRYDIKWLYDNTPVGTPVTVLKLSR